MLTLIVHLVSHEEKKACKQIVNRICLNLKKRKKITCNKVTLNLKSTKINSFKKTFI